jgi:hypothetical protein
MNPFTEFYFTCMKLRNFLDYAIRQNVHFHSKQVSRSTTNQDDILLSFPLEAREYARNQIDLLNSQYHFENFSSAHSADETKENYFYLTMLNEAFNQTGCEFPEILTAADIGPSSWFYVHALTATLTWHKSSTPRTVHLTGYEVDAYRIFSDFHTRKDHAMGNMQGLQNVKYIDHGFSVQPETFDVITLFFPFVFVKDHLQWGLPGNLFDPASLMKAAWNSLRPDGLILIVNQGIDEHRAELKLLRSLNIPVSAAFQIESLLYTYSLNRYIITAQK